MQNDKTTLFASYQTPKIGDSPESDSKITFHVGKLFEGGDAPKYFV